MPLAEVLRDILARSPRPLSPRELTDRIRSEHPDLYQEARERATPDRRGYANADHPLKLAIYGIVTRDPSFVTDRSVRPMTAALAYPSTGAAHAGEVADVATLLDEDEAAETERLAVGDTPIRRRVRPVWFVGATFDGSKDQTERFLQGGLWEVADPTATESKTVREMRAGDPIVIKSTFVRSQNLGFDNRGHAVSAMRLKAVGTIIENPMDGERVSVRWRADTAPREWLFHTYRRTIWQVLPGTHDNDALIAFALDGVPQNIDAFRHDPERVERFGDASGDRFSWTSFYEAIATALRRFAKDRAPLVSSLERLATRHPTLDILRRDQYADGDTGFVRDIDPFTTLGLFNRGLTHANRQAIARDLAAELGLDTPPPTGFDGIPLLNNMNSWFFAFEKNREPVHIDDLWRVFEAALDAVGSDDDETWRAFDQAFDAALSHSRVSWNLGIGLYWSRPWDFLPLDRRTRAYLEQHVGMQTPKFLAASSYRQLMDLLGTRFQEPTFPAHSYPELSLTAWQFDTSPDAGSDRDAEDEAVPEPEIASGADPEMTAPPPLEPYGVEALVEDGCFLPRSDIERLLDVLKLRRNLILQGPPGTGKSWLARRLAFAAMGQRDPSRVRTLQFHPGMTYEDFVRGWRPGAEGRLASVDGTFLLEIDAARNDMRPRFVVIEEINRGQPAQIFGELLTLLEADKRSPNEAIELSYPGPKGDRRPVYVPANLYVIGTMNVADRSIALVDLALRRRFAFMDLVPRLGRTWQDWVVKHRGVDRERAEEIERRIERLNRTIETDSRLGPAYQVGHSYVTPPAPLEAGRTRAWFRDVVETEIGPLLDEYWCDAAKEAQAARDLLLADW